MKVSRYEAARLMRSIQQRPEIEAANRTNPPSRQRQRWHARVIAELAISKEYVEKRKQRGRDLLVRQSRREKAGFYTGLSVASAMAAVGRPTRRVVKDGFTKRRYNTMVQLW